MMRYFHTAFIILVLAFSAVTFMCPNDTAAFEEKLDADARVALEKLYAKSTAAKTLGEKAKGILVFPSITKGGFIVGGQYGKGALLKAGKTAGYYNTIQASYGLQAGLQKYGYALFLMTDSSVKYLEKSEGWELGVGPTITVVDAGVSGSATTTTLKSEIYAYFFDQKGLMAGIGIQGTKITKISPKR
jgi:lipid-binding SYLF domain-containing protein